LEQEVSARLTQEFAAQYQDSIQALCGAAAELQRRADNLVQELEEPAYQLILALGRKLLAAEWERDETLPRLLAEALALLQPDGGLRLRLNPAALARIEQHGGLPETLRGAGLKSDSLELIADAELASTAYRLESGPALLAFDLDVATTALLRRLGWQQPPQPERPPATAGDAQLMLLAEQR
jgi:flagellar biosynthesis/type III secretory pathway protein FliH